METRAEIRTVDGCTTAVGWTGPRTLTIDRPEAAGGGGRGYSGGELLALAVGACYTNDIFREATKRGVRVERARVTVTIAWTADLARAEAIAYSVELAGPATEQELLALCDHTDGVAEIHNTLRVGTRVELAERRATSTG
jgi:uncharacterized OsmC-like protein